MMHSAIARVALGAGLFSAAGCFENRNKSIEFMNQGVEAAKQKLYSTAERQLKLASDTDPSNYLAWSNLGEVEEDQKKWDEAVKAFSEAVKLQDGNATYHYKLGLAYQELKKGDQAKAEYEAALKNDDHLFKAHFRLGTVLEAAEKFKEADAEYRKAIEGNPRFVEPYIKLGYLYLDHDYDKESVAVFQAGVLGNDSDGEVHLGLGRALQKNKQYDEAVKELRKALALNGDLFGAVYDIGMTYKMMDDKKDAKEWLQRFITNAGSKGTPEMMKAASDAIYQLDAP
jgi:tetratricopeptide (TPR) repeat protein